MRCFTSIVVLKQKIALGAFTADRIRNEEQTNLCF